MSEIYRKVQSQFSKTADAYVKSAIHAKGADLDKLVELAGDVRAKRALDVATGGGHTALAFARAGAKVTATDLTPEMLKTAEAHISQQGFALSYHIAAAEALPFEPASFDIVTCRIAPHHFADPVAFVQEAARVLVAGGMLLLIDNISPLDKTLAEIVNHIEKTRDPSHVEAYSLQSWFDWLFAARLEPHYLERFRRKKMFSDWVAYAQAEGVKATLEAYVLALPDPVKAYLEVEVEGDKLESLSHEVTLLKALKPA